MILVPVVIDDDHIWHQIRNSTIYVLKMVVVVIIIQCDTEIEIVATAQLVSVCRSNEQQVTHECFVIQNIRWNKMSKYKNKHVLTGSPCHHTTRTIVNESTCFVVLSWRCRYHRHIECMCLQLIYFKWIQIVYYICCCSWWMIPHEIIRR